MKFSRRRQCRHCALGWPLLASLLLQLTNLSSPWLPNIFYTTAFVPSASRAFVSSRWSMEPLAAPTRLRQPSFLSMVVSDPMESTTALVSKIPNMPIRADDGIYAVTKPEEHVSLMRYAEQTQQLVVLKVFAPWCRACKGLEPKFVQMSREAEYAPSSKLPIIYASLSIQHNKAFVQSLGVLALPTIQFYVAGQLIDTFPCGPSKVPILRRKLSQLISDHVDESGALKEGSMEQAAALAEETAASIAAAKAAKLEAAAASALGDGEGEQTASLLSSVTTSKDQVDESSQPTVMTAEDRSLFENIPFFKGISIADFDQMLAKVVPFTFEPGSILVREGKPGRTFYVIKKGEVEICQQTYQSPSNSYDALLKQLPTSDPLVQPSVVGASSSTSNSLYIGTVVNRLGPGDFFGERALITGEPRAASIRVAESGPVTLWAFDKDIFPQSCVLSGKSRNTAVVGSKSNTQFMDQVNTKYGVRNITDVDETEENLQQIIEEYQQSILDKQLRESATANQVRGSIHKPQPLVDEDIESITGSISDEVLSSVLPTSLPSPTLIETNSRKVQSEKSTATNKDAIFSLLTRFQMIRHVSRCFKYMQESKTVLKWGDAGSRYRRNMLVERLSESRQMEYKEIFHIMDSNKDGCIDLTELQRLMNSIGESSVLLQESLPQSSDTGILVSRKSNSTFSFLDVLDADTCIDQDGGMTYEDFMGLMAEAEFYYLFRDIFASLDSEDSGYVRARDLDRVLCGVRDLISDDRKSVIDVEDKDMLIDYEQFSRMLLGTTLL
jgi:calmodulin